MAVNLESIDLTIPMSHLETLSRKSRLESLSRPNRLLDDFLDGLDWKSHLESLLDLLGKHGRY